MKGYGNNYSLSSQLLSLKKSIASNNRQAIQKQLCQIKNLSQDFLNQALFWCIQNYKVEQQTDECLHILLKYYSQTSKSKANPNCQINLQTPLIAACIKGQISLVKRLVQNGAKPDLMNSQKKHPLQFILNSRQQNYDVAEYLITQIQSVNILINDKYPILVAVQREFPRIFKHLLDKGSELVYENQNLLHSIMKQRFRNTKKKKKIIKQLLTKYALFTQTDKNNKIPIQYEENQQIKLFYQQNFKTKKTHEPLLSSIQKATNSSSIFINQKASRRESKAILKQKDKGKNLHQSGSFIGKPTKYYNKQSKVQSKQSKEQDVSFQQQIDDRSQGQLEEQDKYPQKIIHHTKLNNLTPTISGNKKSERNGLISSKSTYNSSIFSNINNKQSSNLSFIPSTGSTQNKIKSKYGSIGPKTETGLKNLIGNKKAQQNQKSELKKYYGGIPPYSTVIPPYSTVKQVNSKKKYLNEDQKKQMGSNMKINHTQEITPSNLHLKDSNQYHLKQKQQTIQLKQDQQKIVHNNKDTQQNQSLTKNEQIKYNISQIIQQQVKGSIQTSKIKSNCQVFTDQSGQRGLKAEWQITLERYQKMMGQLTIKEEQQTTDLKQLKDKFNQLFRRYHFQRASQKQFMQSYKLKELQVLSSQGDTANCHRERKPSIVVKQVLRGKDNGQNGLNQAILNIQRNCQEAAEKKTNSIENAIDLITRKILPVLQSCRKQKMEVSIQTYGSRANGLQIQTSDVDLLIICNINAGVKDLMSQLERADIFNCAEINQAKFLSNTSMPIVKLSLSQSFKHLSIDLTFQIRGHTGIRCTSLIKQFIASQQLLKPLVITLKTLLNFYELCDTYTGGLGSYSLTLMAIALLQFTQIKKVKQNLGDILLEFLLFYGFQMDYICQAIIIHPPGFNERQAFSIYQLPYSLDLTPKLIIYDPLNPVNNVGRATYRIVQLKKLFKIWYVKLITELHGRKDGIQQLIKINTELLNKTSIL